MMITITKKELEAIETGYALMEGHCIDPEIQREVITLRKFLDKCRIELYKKEKP